MKYFLPLDKIYTLTKKLWYLPYTFKSFEHILPPFRFFFNITARCNVACSYCYNKEFKKKKYSELPLNKIIQIIDKLPKRALVILSGGEPLMRKDFCEIIKHIHQQKKQQALMTNGLLLNDHNIIEIIKNNVLNISISIDGTKHYYESVKGKNTYSKLISNIKKINHHKRQMQAIFPNIDWKITVFDTNIDLIPALLLLAKELKIDSVTLSLPKKNDYQFNDELKNNLILEDELYASVQRNYPALDTSTNHFIKKYTEIIALAKTLNIVLRSYPQIHQAADIQQYALPKKICEKYQPCLEPWIGMNINPQGEVYPCLSIKMGDLKTQSFKEIFYGNNYLAFRKLLHQKKIFPACDGCCWANCKSLPKTIY